MKLERGTREERLRSEGKAVERWERGYQTGDGGRRLGWPRKEGTDIEERETKTDRGVYE